MHCLYCGKSLSLLKKLKHAEFCSPAHRQSYMDLQQQLGVQRLMERHRPAAAASGHKAAPAERGPAKQDPVFGGYIGIAPPPYGLRGSIPVAASPVGANIPVDLPEWAAKTVMDSLVSRGLAGTVAYKWAVPRQFSESRFLVSPGLEEPWRLKLAVPRAAAAPSWLGLIPTAGEVPWRQYPAAGLVKSHGLRDALESHAAQLLHPHVPTAAPALGHGATASTRLPLAEVVAQAHSYQAEHFPVSRPGFLGISAGLRPILLNLAARSDEELARLPIEDRPANLELRTLRTEVVPHLLQGANEAFTSVLALPSLGRQSGTVELAAGCLLAVPASARDFVWPRLDTGDCRFVLPQSTPVTPRLPAERSMPEPAGSSRLRALEPAFLAGYFSSPGFDCVPSSPHWISVLGQPSLMPAAATPVLEGAGLLECPVVAPDNRKGAPLAASCRIHPHAPVASHYFPQLPVAWKEKALSRQAAKVALDFAPAAGPRHVGEPAPLRSEVFPGIPRGLRPVRMAECSNLEGIRSLSHLAPAMRDFRRSLPELSAVPSAAPAVVKPSGPALAAAGRGATTKLVTLRYLAPSPREGRALLLQEPEASRFQLPALQPVARLKVAPVAVRPETQSEFLSFRDKLARLQDSEGWKFWRQAPADLKWIAIGLPVVLVLWLQPFAASKPESRGASTRQMTFQEAVSTRWESVKQNIASRAGVSLEEDFRSGLGNWEGKGDWAKSWSYDSAGLVRPGSLALYSPSVGLSDYSAEFTAQIEKRALSWVFRASDLSNYYAVRIFVAKPGPLPTLALERWAVIGGKDQDRKTVPVALTTRNDVIYRVRLNVQGSSFTAILQDQVVDSWTDEALPAGGVGFFVVKGDQSRVHRLSVTHQNDTLGRLCAFLVPYNMHTSSGSWKQ